jgi:hypothetical protein
MKLVIQTQFRENYGAHDWDGKGECPQYWKFKGGDTYVVEVNLQEAQDKSFYTRVAKCIEHSSDYAEEYIIGETLVDDIDFKESDHCDEWESPIYCILMSDRDELMCKQIARKYNMDATPFGERSWSQNEEGRSEMSLITFEGMDKLEKYYADKEAA